MNVPAIKKLHDRSAANRGPGTAIPRLEAVLLSVLALVAACAPNSLDSTRTVSNASDEKSNSERVTVSIPNGTVDAGVVNERLVYITEALRLASSADPGEPARAVPVVSGAPASNPGPVNVHPSAGAGDPVFNEPASGSGAGAGGTDSQILDGSAVADMLAAEALRSRPTFSQQQAPDDAHSGSKPSESAHANAGDDLDVESVDDEEPSSGQNGGSSGSSSANDETPDHSESTPQADDDVDLPHVEGDAHVRTPPVEDSENQPAESTTPGRQSDASWKATGQDRTDPSGEDPDNGREEPVGGTESSRSNQVGPSGRGANNNDAGSADEGDKTGRGVDRNPAQHERDEQADGASGEAGDTRKGGDAKHNPPNEKTPRGEDSSAPNDSSDESGGPTESDDATAEGAADPGFNSGGESAGGEVGTGNAGEPVEPQTAGPHGPDSTTPGRNDESPGRKAKSEPANADSAAGTVDADDEDAVLPKGRGSSRRGGR